MTALDAAGLESRLAKILEQMAFVLAEGADEPRWDSGYDAHAWIEIRGEDIALGAAISADRAFVMELASSMIGALPEDLDSFEQATSALMELANVLGGEVIKSLGGQDREIRLSLPSRLGPKDLARRLKACGEPVCRSCVESEAGFLQVYLVAL